ncbi:hypothetical protein KKC88_05740 [Patescibacteria group bacterium]|nr:hypothetical protein [Patescibacteria group bacterium]MBU1673624.1 hypothetical protein [Patescibacteria group bacterium]MBU1963888.1 hypothetical protein [Patescibacteria group bacterium]
MAEKALKLFHRYPNTERKPIGEIPEFFDFDPDEKEEKTGQRVRDFIKGYFKTMIEINRTAEREGMRPAKLKLVEKFLKDLDWATIDEEVDMEAAEQKLECAAKKASQFTEELIDKFSPRRRLMRELPSVAADNNVVSLIQRTRQLIREMHEMKREKILKIDDWAAIEREYFEIVRKLLLTKDFLEIDFTKGGEGALESDRKKMETEIKREGVFKMEDGEILKEDKTIRTFIDPKTGECKYSFLEGYSHDPDSEELKKKLEGLEELDVDAQVRYMKMPSLLRDVLIKKGTLKAEDDDDVYVPIVFQSRIKNPLSQESKVLREPGVLNPGEVLDIRGMRFIPISIDGEEDVRLNQLILEKLLDKIFPGPGTARSVRYAKDKRPKKSSPSLRIDAFKDRFKGKDWEVQVQSMTNYISSRTMASDKINHDLYRAHQHMDGTFPNLFPKFIYGIDWQSLDEQRKVTALVERRTRNNLRDEGISLREKEI